MTFKYVKQYEDHLWYPILVKFSGSSVVHIREMQGKEVNEWNKMVREQWERDTRNSRKGWSV